MQRTRLSFEERSARDEAVLTDGFVWLMEHRARVLADPLLRDVRVDCVAVGSAFTGALDLDLGRLLTLWSEGLLTYPSATGALRYAYRLGGSIFSGAHQLVFLDPTRPGRSEVGTLEDRGFTSTFFELFRREKRFAPRLRSSLTLPEVLGRLGAPLDLDPSR